MDLTWLADSPQSRRRTRALRACPSCQRKKKRCIHFDRHSVVGGAPNDSRSQGRAGGSSSNPPAKSPALGGVSTLRNFHPSSPGIASIERFVGDLNPEAAIREELDAPDGPHLRDRVGLWVNASGQRSHDGDDKEGANASILSAEGSVHCGPESLPMPSILRRRYSSALKACERLPRSTFDNLAAIFFSRVNHILPLVDPSLLTSGFAEVMPSVFLEQAICLVAAKDAAAGSHLRLTANGSVYTARDFCSELYRRLACAMENDLEHDRIIRIRILALMSLHSEGYEGPEAASMHLCQAIHHAQTVGLHLERPNPSQEDSLTTLFWCLWTLDKMHASIGGRPLLLADRDIGIKRQAVDTHQAKSAFDVWFALSEMLSNVISFYRPSADGITGWETNYPSFEEVIGDHVREDLNFATLSVLELYYHAISILSCRYRPSQRPSGSRPSYTRQGLAAVRINLLVGSECARGLPPLPIVPYAVSLSMGVSYQQLRTSKLITHFNRAKASLESCCDLLQALGTYWYSAEAMARLGRKAMRQIDGSASRNKSYRDPQMLSAMDTNNVSLNNQALVTADADADASVVSLPTSSKPSESLRVPTSVVAHGQSIRPLDDEQHHVEQPVTGGGCLADIDMLFDDFLDLSLPTHFWDPVFFSTEPDGNV
ncbi:hypothetical protein BDW69DRAFT_202399 [Aspergillus filifer]